MANGALTRDPLIRAFGAVLRGHRDAAGLSRPQLAKALGCTPQWIEKLETGQRAPSPATAEDLDTYFKTPATFHAMWAEIRRAGRCPELPPGFAGFVDLEAKASIMYIFENMLITGLFQTPGYAREIVKAAGRRSEAIERLVTMRIERQEILSRDDPPEIVLVLDEGVLHRPIGDAETRKEQIGHLIEGAQDPNVTVQNCAKPHRIVCGSYGCVHAVKFRRESRSRVCRGSCGGSGNRSDRQG